jgi:hypothetical protein
MSILMNQPSRYGQMMGRRFGKLQLLRYIGKDQSSNAVVFDVRCECGRTEQVELAQLQAGKKYGCVVCVPPVKDQNAREWLASERKKQTDAAERKRQESEAQAAEQQRQAAALREADRQRRRQELLGDALDKVSPPPAPEEQWSAPRTFKPYFG